MEENNIFDSIEKENKKHFRRFVLSAGFTGVILGSTIALLNMTNHTEQACIITKLTGNYEHQIRMIEKKGYEVNVNHTSENIIYKNARQVTTIDGRVLYIPEDGSSISSEQPILYVVPAQDYLSIINENTNEVIGNVLVKTYRHKK